MKPTQAEKSLLFSQLHRNCLLLPNAWNAGTAKLLAALGFKALGTTSAGLAFSLGRQDGCGALSRDETLENARSIVAASDLPVTGDLENGWSAHPDAMSSAIRGAAEVGLVGASIEDCTGHSASPIYELQLASDRIRAAAECVKSLDIPFTLTARADGLARGALCLKDTIVRLQAYQEAGADVLYAPGLSTKADIASVVASVDRPLNVVIGLGRLDASVEELAALGVSRISLGSTLARAALGAFIRDATEFRAGNTGFIAKAAPFAELMQRFEG
ncbi:MAG: isocitrate lyase/phosphoenolpyruvate mutase family protein [Kofleriaceae bacterium]|nr:isocitrate lyase/phosphoenolpyruvate mutase family protein [Kofleriaceae bacterium]